ncbi:MAG: type II secretion system protein J [Candidatus Methylacidiphilales bacterium]|nr:prepilin-type N-terminal cleavage/methylation domain-containing protein [Candidatus Methylacidiphilales bacterium]
MKKFQDCPAPRRSARAFSLVEMIVAMSVFAILMVFLAYVVNGAQKAWLMGDQKVEIYQSGRAALELFSRELSGAVVSDKIQFVQTPDLAAKVTDLATNAPSLFWMAPGKSTDKGNLSEIGYYLTRNAAKKTYQLNRFYVSGDNADGYYLGLDNYSLQTTANKRIWSFANEARWITTLNALAFNPTSTKKVVSVVADGVVAMWIRCLDPAGNPIPWLSQAPAPYSSGTIQFSSGACFQMTTADAPFSDAAATFSNEEKTFQYTSGPANPSTTPATAVANRLPASVEITLIVVDSYTLRRNVTIPAMPTLVSAKEVTGQIKQFQTDLVKAGISTARTFTVRVKLVNGL